MEITLKHAGMIARWFSLEKYQGLSLDALMGLVWFHFPCYRNQDISKDLESILLSIR